MLRTPATCEQLLESHNRLGQPRPVQACHLWRMEPQETSCKHSANTASHSRSGMTFLPTGQLGCQSSAAQHTRDPVARATLPAQEHPQARQRSSKGGRPSSGLSRLACRVTRSRSLHRGKATLPLVGRVTFAEGCRRIPVQCSLGKALQQLSQAVPHTLTAAAGTGLRERLQSLLILILHSLDQAQALALALAQALLSRSRRNWDGRSWTGSHVVSVAFWTPHSGDRGRMANATCATSAECD